MGRYVSVVLPIEYMVPAGSWPPPALPIWYPPPSRSHMLYCHAGLVPPITYPYDTSLQGSAYMPIQPMQTICNQLLPIQYLSSSHVLSTVKISYAVHMC